MRVLISGGAGFVGCALARRFRQDGDQVVALDNLRRRGSELNLPLLRELGADFVHGDIRVAADLDDLPGEFDVFVEASAEPSVHAGLDGSPRYVLQTNLEGTLNCLELARRRAGCLLFLSTSRVYSIGPLRAIPLREETTRFEIDAAGLGHGVPGLGVAGIAESFPTNTHRSLYGATKLASEMVVQEYVAAYGLKAVIDRCGVLAGPGQFGRRTQGIATYWMAAHRFGRPLRLTGFGGTGKQVRDLLHPDDLYDLLRLQLERIDEVTGQTFNVGGGREISVSLLELTEMCREIAGKRVPVEGDPETSPVDVPLYLTDARAARDRFGWSPRHGVREILESTHAWIRDHEAALRGILG